MPSIGDWKWGHKLKQKDKSDLFVKKRGGLELRYFIYLILLKSTKYHCRQCSEIIFRWLRISSLQTFPEWLDWDINKSICYFKKNALISIFSFFHQSYL